MERLSGRGQEDHHRTFYHVHGYQLPTYRTFVGRSNFSTRPHSAKVSTHGPRATHLLFPRLPTSFFPRHVEQQLPGHGRVFLALFFRHEVQHCSHQRTLPPTKTIASRSPAVSRAGAIRSAVRGRTGSSRTVAWLDSEIFSLAASYFFSSSTVGYGLEHRGCS
jgi:hypothetical protein